MNVKIYHNPRCSKSREALALLKEKGIEPEISEYLKTPPGPEELSALLRCLGVSARDLLRQGEPAYKALGLSDATLSEAALIDALCENPILMERPVVRRDDRAVIARPPERVLELFP